MAKEGHEPKIQWALVDGEPRYVSDFYHLRGGTRPEAICLECGQRMSMRLGDDRAHHYAHLPGSLYCAASEPETALHQNVKFHLASELAKTDCIHIQQFCKYRDSSSCEASRDVEWLQGWTKVEVEYQLNPYRPDIALLADSEVIGAIEVFVTHAVEPDKAAYLQQQKVSWLEVKGDEALYTGESVWRADASMPYLRLHPMIPQWACGDCSEREAQQAAKWAEQAEQWRNNHKEVISYKFVDYFWPSGNKYRDVFAIVEEVRDGERVGLWLMCRKKQLCDLSGFPEEVARKKALQVYERALDYVRRRGGIVDSPMSWKRDGHEVFLETSELSKDVLDVETSVFFKNGRYPYRYAWWKAKNKWFLPKAHRDINWDDPTSTLLFADYYERE